VCNGESAFRFCPATVACGRAAVLFSLYWVALANTICSNALSERGCESLVAIVVDVRAVLFARRLVDSGVRVEMRK